LAPALTKVVHSLEELGAPVIFDHGMEFTEISVREEPALSATVNSLEKFAIARCVRFVPLV
jgi:hypothetical protein